MKSKESIWITEFFSQDDKNFFNEVPVQSVLVSELWYGYDRQIIIQNITKLKCKMPTEIVKVLPIYILKQLPKCSRIQSSFFLINLS